MNPDHSRPNEEPENPINYWLSAHYLEVDSGTFYRELFPEGSLEAQGELTEGKYRGVAVRIKEGRARRFSISDGLEILEQIDGSQPDEFWLASPVSYAGKSQRQEMARHLYAIAVDLDGIRIENPSKPRGLEAMWNQMDGRFFPIPTFIVSSGNGLHLYYVLDQPIALYKSVIRQLQKFRHAFIQRTWNSFITELYKRPQYESVTQGFRMVGSATKRGNRVRAYRVGSIVTIDYLNEFVPPASQLTDLHYKSDLPLAEAKKLYPDWYQKRIIEGRPRGSWRVKRALYDWWRDQKISQATTGHRYFYLMALAIYAAKCGISEEELYKDSKRAFKELKKLDTVDNPLTENDLIKALEMFNTAYQTFPRRSIEAITGIPMPPNKRNGRKQEVHLRGARAIQQIDMEVNGTDWRYHGGAPTKNFLVYKWRIQHPEGRKIECEKELGISRPTVLKWWEWTPEKDA